MTFYFTDIQFNQAAAHVSEQKITDIISHFQIIMAGKRFTNCGNYTEGNRMASKASA